MIHPWIVLWTLLALCYYATVTEFIVHLEFRKFYPHPVVGLHKTLRNEKLDTLGCVLSTDLAYCLIYLPITPVWVVSWVVYTIFKKIRNSRSKQINKSARGAA